MFLRPLLCIYSSTRSRLITVHIPDANLFGAGRRRNMSTKIDASSIHQKRLDAVKKAAQPLQTIGENYKAILDLTADAEIVLLGECTHGSHEFYRERAQITKLLIQEHGFSAVAVEADWPDAYQVSEFVHKLGDSTEAMDVLETFERFPQWMWNNADMLDFIGWMRDHNEIVGLGNTVRFYGLDLYSLYKSARRVIEYLSDVDPEAAKRAASRYECISRFGEDGQQYAYAIKLGLTKECTKAVVTELIQLLHQSDNYRLRTNGREGDERFFDAEQNSRLIVAAEEYYRTMISDDVSSWNLRDEHMADTLERIREHLIRMKRLPKVVVWAHNSHLGDARATDMGWRRSELNIGQLARQAYGSKMVNIGFTSYNGTVTAASKWNGHPERKRIRDALPGSYEHLFHQAEIPRFLLDFRNNEQLHEALKEPLLERAIGVIYAPATERQSHYFKASISDQFDAVIHIDHTRAVEPTKSFQAWEHINETPDTYPSGF